MGRSAAGAEGLARDASPPLDRCQQIGRQTGAGTELSDLVTMGAKADGVLLVRVFTSQVEADAAGFPWVGR